MLCYQILFQQIIWSKKKKKEKNTTEFRAEIHIHSGANFFKKKYDRNAGTFFLMAQQTKRPTMQTSQTPDPACSASVSNITQHINGRSCRCSFPIQVLEMSLY